MNYNRIRNYKKLIEVMQKLDEHEKFIFLYGYFYDMVKYNYYTWLYIMLTHGCNMPISYCEHGYQINDLGDKEMLLFGLSDVTSYDDSSMFKPDGDEYIIFKDIIKARWEYDVYSFKGICEYKNHVTSMISEYLRSQISDSNKFEELISYFKTQIVDESFVPPYGTGNMFIYDIPYLIYKTYWNQPKFEDGLYHNGLLREGVCRHFTEFINTVLSEFGISSISVVSKNGMFHAFNMVEFNDEIRFIDMTKELYLRDGITSCDYCKGDFYLCNIDTLFDLVPDRVFLSLDDVSLTDGITKDNYRDNISKLSDSLGKKRTLNMIKK